MADSDAVAVFAREDIEAVATDRDLEPDELSEALADHQRAVSDLPGVENLVYEWRKDLREPLLERTDGAYYLVVPDHVWTEFADHLDLSETMRTAVAEVHRRTVADRDGVSENPQEGTAYVVLDRTA